MDTSPLHISNYQIIKLSKGIHLLKTRAWTGVILQWCLTPVTLLTGVLPMSCLHTCFAEGKLYIYNIIYICAQRLGFAQALQRRGFPFPSWWWWWRRWWWWWCVACRHCGVWAKPRHLPYIYIYSYTDGWGFKHSTLQGVCCFSFQSLTFFFYQKHWKFHHLSNVRTAPSPARQATIVT